jgi:hypothetical protein
MTKKQKPFFHKINDEEYQWLCSEKKTWGYVLKHYRQPEWCTYPEALAGIWGCWSLIYRYKINRNKCKRCGYYKDERPIK